MRPVSLLETHKQLIYYKFLILYDIAVQLAFKLLAGEMFLKCYTLTLNFFDSHLKYYSLFGNGCVSKTLLYKNQSIDLLYKSIGWFLYDLSF